MNELRLVQGFKKEKVMPNYRKMYSTAYTNALRRVSKGMQKSDDIGDIQLDDRRMLVLYGVKMINATDVENFDFDYELLKSTFNIISFINVIIGSFTPRELQTVFPITKDYDGEKYEYTDYFYAKNFINEFGLDKKIGDEAVRFHMNYVNTEIRLFAVSAMCVMSAIRRAEGGKGIMEEFLEEHGFTTYTETTDAKGNKLLRNNDTGEMIKVSKPRPRHLKVVK